MEGRLIEMSSKTWQLRWNQWLNMTDDSHERILYLKLKKECKMKAPQSLANIDCTTHLQRGGSLGYVQTVVALSWFWATANSGKLHQATSEFRPWIAKARRGDSRTQIPKALCTFGCFYSDHLVNPSLLSFRNRTWKHRKTQIPSIMENVGDWKETQVDRAYRYCWNHDRVDDALGQQHAGGKPVTILFLKIEKALTKSYIYIYIYIRSPLQLTPMAFLCL